MKWRRTDWPLFVLELPRREPGLCVRLIGWREAANGADVITLDARGRYWLWGSEMSKWVNHHGEPERNADIKFAVRTRVLVPVFGPVPRAWRPTTLSDETRAAINALED